MISAYFPQGTTYMSLDMSRFFRDKVHNLCVEEINKLYSYSTILLFPEVSEIPTVCSKVQKDLRTGQSILWVFYGMSEFRDEESILKITEDVRRTYCPADLRIVLDSTAKYSKLFKKSLPGKVYEVSGFQNLTWGIEDDTVYLMNATHSYLDIPQIFTVNVNNYLNSAEIGKVFVRIRRPDLEREYLIRKLLSETLLNSNSIFTYNVGSGETGKMYNEGLFSVTYNIVDKSFKEKDHRYCYVHELNHSSARKYMFCEIVAEHAFFITEKTYKPMLLGIPCFYFGYKGLIEHLHEKGFKTFDRWWDESYDSLDYGIPKVNAILKEVRKICRWTEAKKNRVFREMVPVLEHNINVLMQKEQNVIDLEYEINNSIKKFKIL